MSRNWPLADDPMLVLQRKQSRTCLGCRHLDQDRTPGFEKFTCRKGRCKASRDPYEMERCTKFTDQKEAAKKAAKKCKAPIF